MTLVLFESLRQSDEEEKTLLATSFEEILQTGNMDDVPRVLKHVERAVNDGNFAFGFLTYEAGFVFLPAMPAAPSTDFPLVWFAITKAPQILPAGHLPQRLADRHSHAISNLQLSKSLSEYRNSIESIRRHIESGQTYQVNFTIRYRGDFRGSPRSLYRELRRKQKVSYAAYIETEDWSILSLSPELFFRWKEDQISMRPMKGTAARGRTTEEDREQARRLKESLKERSENLMIVDLLRSDLGKICETGTIAVTKPVEVERYETLLQMTSTITGKLKQETAISDIFRAIFPSGSVTGAPKIRTMQIIHELEKEPRGIYTGSIGFLSAKEAVFNVAIRTAVVNLKKRTIEMGIGSGILHEAHTVREYQECILKAEFLTQPPLEFQILETMLWEPEAGYRNLPLHLMRLLESAEYFLFAADPIRIEKRLRKLEQKLRLLNFAHRVRLLLSHDGKIGLDFHRLKPLPDSPVKIRLSQTKTNSGNRFLYHKTTNRSFYEQELRSVQAQGFFDVIFQNERNEITEGAISNVFIKAGDSYYTPPVSCGLLAGTWRRHVIETRLFPTEEKVLYLNDLQKADAIFLTNAIRGVLPAKLVLGDL